MRKERSYKMNSRLEPTIGESNSMREKLLEEKWNLSQEYRERYTCLDELQFEIGWERIIIRHERIFSESYKSNWMRGSQVHLMRSYTFVIHRISEGELHSLKCGVTILFQARGLICQVRDFQFNWLIPWDYLRIHFYLSIKSEWL